ncbi:hypothetical protein [Azospirillum largimobile]
MFVLNSKALCFGGRVETTHSTFNPDLVAIIEVSAILSSASQAPASKWNRRLVRYNGTVFQLGDTVGTALVSFSP